VSIINTAYELVSGHEDLPKAELRDQVDISLLGAVHMMKAATPVLEAFYIKAMNVPTDAPE
jgi:NAD(P)-dependent dehydrogenase (short-subunit alcohol dehydrogenase family)